jgi:hypothetical protein
VGVKKSLLVASATLALANAITLWHVARNSAGVPDTSITLNSEALSSLSRSDAKDEDSSVNFNIRWQYPNMPDALDDSRWPPVWTTPESCNVSASIVPSPLLLPMPRLSTDANPPAAPSWRCSLQAQALVWHCWRPLLTPTHCEADIRIRTMS